jgi:hypothetical protein
MPRSASWPLAESARRPFDAPRPHPHPRRRASRAVWALVASAFLCGALLSAAGFAIGWKHQAQRGSSAASALVAATARTHVLAAALTRTRAALGAARTRSASIATSRDSLARADARLTAANGRLASALAAARRRAAAVGDAAAPLVADLDRVASELHALTGYLTSTPASQLDAGYVQTQVAYLTKTVDAFRAAVAGVRTQAVPGR